MYYGAVCFKVRVWILANQSLVHLLYFKFSRLNFVLKPSQLTTWQLHFKNIKMNGVQISRPLILWLICEPTNRITVVMGMQIYTFFELLPIFFPFKFYIVAPDSDHYFTSQNYSISFLCCQKLIRDHSRISLNIILWSRLKIRKGLNVKFIYEWLWGEYQVLTWKQIKFHQMLISPNEMMGVLCLIFHILH